MKFGYFLLVVLALLLATGLVESFEKDKNETKPDDCDKCGPTRMIGCRKGRCYYKCIRRCLGKDNKFYYGMSTKLETVKKLKELLKKYWYIAVPVHLGTSGLWLGTFYGATKAGLNFVPLLEKTSLPEKYIEPLKTGNMGNYAQTMVLFKLAAPFRYASTLYVARTTVRYLRKRGLVK